MSDRIKIEQYLKEHKTITCLQAIHKIGVYNLRSRASEMKLISEMIDVTRADGVTTKVARYSLPDNYFKQKKAS